MDLQRICKSAFAWPWEDPREAAQIEADVAARTMQAEANAKRRDRGLPEVSYVDPTAHTGRAITPEELEYKKKYTDWIVQQFEQGRKGGGIPTWQAFMQHKQNPSSEWSGAPHEMHNLGVRKRDETPVWNPQIDKSIQQVNQNGGSVNFSENPSLYRKMDRETRSENAPGVLRPMSGRSPSGKMNHWWVPNVNRNTAYPSTVDYRPDRSMEAVNGTAKTASAIDLQAVQRAMTKRAVLSWNPANWFKSEDEYRREQYDRQRMAALQQFENNMNALDPGRAQRMQALQQRDAMLAQQIDANLRAHAAGQPYQSVMVPNRPAMVAANGIVQPGRPNLIDPAAAAKTMQSPGYIAATPTVDANGQTIRRPGMDTHITGSYTINGTRYNKFSDGAITTQPQAEQFLAQQKRNDQMIAQRRQQAPQTVTAGTASGRPAQTSVPAVSVAQTRPTAQQRPAQAAPPPSAAPAAATQRRQGYKTPDGQWHDITPTTKAPTDVQVGTFRQPKPRTSNPAALPKTHFQYKPKY